MTNELTHFGIKGQKWGVRRFQTKDGSLTNAGKKRYSESDKAKQDYKDAKKELRTAKKEFRKVGRKINIGMKGIDRYRTAEKKVQDADMKALVAKAKYKAAKSKDGEKAEFKTYVKAMSKNGLPGSGVDVAGGGKSTRIYNQLYAEKGKAYADKVSKKVQNRAYADMAAGATVAIGAAVVSAMLEMNS